MPRVLKDPKQDGPWFREYEGRELEFCRDVLGKKTPKGVLSAWAAQRYIVEATMKHHFVTVRSPRKIGKSFAVGGLLIPAFFYTAPSRVLLLGSTLSQVRDVVWAEVAKSYNGAPSPLPGRLGTRSLRIDEGHWAQGLASRTPDHLRGHHAGVTIPGDPDEDFVTPEDLKAAMEMGHEATRLLVVIDEPETILAETFRVLMGMLSGPNVYCVMIGNPMLGMDDDHEFVHSHTGNSVLPWHRIKVSAFPDEDYPDPLTADKSFYHVPEYLIPKETLKRVAAVFEPNDPIFLSDYLGQFSTGSASSLVCPRYILEEALTKYVPTPTGPRMGVDIGTVHDPTVFSLVFDLKKEARHEMRLGDDDEAQVTIARTLAKLCVTWGKALGEKYPDRWDGKPIPAECVSVDVTDGTGVCDFLASQGMHVDRVNFAMKAQGHWAQYVQGMRFKNTRAEMHWTLRRLLQEGRACIPELPEFLNSWDQAQWTHYTREPVANGVMIQMEKKDKVIARKGRSPDDFDADILAFRETLGNAHFGTATKYDAPPRLPNNAQARAKLARQRKGFRPLGS